MNLRNLKRQLQNNDTIAIFFILSQKMYIFSRLKINSFNKNRFFKSIFIRLQSFDINFISRNDFYPFSSTMMEVHTTTFI